MSQRRSKAIRMAARNALKASFARDTKAVDYFTDVLIYARATEQEVRRAVQVFARKEKHLSERVPLHDDIGPQEPQND